MTPVATFSRNNWHHHNQCCKCCWMICWTWKLDYGVQSNGSTCSHFSSAKKTRRPQVPPPTNPNSHNQLSHKAYQKNSNTLKFNVIWIRDGLRKRARRSFVCRGYNLYFFLDVKLVNFRHTADQSKHFFLQNFFKNINRQPLGCVVISLKLHSDKVSSFGTRPNWGKLIPV